METPKCCFSNMLSHHSPATSPRSCGAHWCWICEEQIVGPDTFEQHPDTEMGSSDMEKAWMTWSIIKHRKTIRKSLVSIWEQPSIYLLLYVIVVFTRGTGLWPRTKKYQTVVIHWSEKPCRCGFSSTGYHGYETSHISVDNLAKKTNPKSNIFKMIWYTCVLSFRKATLLFVFSPAHSVHVVSIPRIVWAVLPDSSEASSVWTSSVSPLSCSTGIAKRI